MKLKAKPISFEAGGKGIVILNRADVSEMGIRALDRVVLKKNNKKMIVIVDVADKFANRGEMITNEEINKIFKIKKGSLIDVVPACPPESVGFIKQKMAGMRLDYKKLRAVVKDVVEKHLSDIELTAFVSSLEIHGMIMSENEGLVKAMVETGKNINIPKKLVVDKHSCGGIPGDKTSLLAVPIIAAAGLTIPKTSSRAITSPAGTGDRMEILAPVELTAGEIIKVVKKTNGCLVWGGALDLAPADDAFIKIEHPLSIDPLMLPSIISKKKAVNAKYVVIDMPTGRGTKFKTIGTAREAAENFIELGRRVGINIVCTITYGEQPLGYAIGPALEAQEALLTLGGDGPGDLVQKVINVTGTLFDMVGKNKTKGKEHAFQILKSGKADKKFREIIEAQGGNPKIRPSDIGIGKKSIKVVSKIDGRVLWIKNAEIAAIGREAGAPKDKGAGLKLSVKINSPVKKGDTLFTIYSNRTDNLNRAFKLAKDYEPVIVGKKLEERILLDMVPSKIPHRRIFMLER
ncbi:MAG: AMP phosphorylase [Candidatus Aenigmarchaeota archaeon]|nr:AMP phosphorylase [Candidatus Aenigmarchaeota archaeon]